MSEHTPKRYKCSACGHVLMQTTNHHMATWSWGHSNCCPLCPPYKKYPEYGGSPRGNAWTNQQPRKANKYHYNHFRDLIGPSWNPARISITPFAPSTTYGVALWTLSPASLTTLTVVKPSPTCATGLAQAGGSPRGTHSTAPV